MIRARGWTSALGAALIAGVLSVLPNAPAIACPEGQSEGAFGWCYPNVGGVVGQTWEAAKDGDWNTVAKGVGDVFITLNYPAAAVVGHFVLDTKDREIVSTIVGRGLILHAVGVPPVFIGVDAASGIASAIELRGQQAMPMPVPSAPSRTVKTYGSITEAACIVQKPGDQRITVGWAAVPVFVEKATGVNFTFPEIDLQKGDTITIRGGACPEYSKIEDTIVFTEAAFKYEDSQTAPGPAKQMKYCMWGSETDLDGVKAP